MKTEDVAEKVTTMGSWIPQLFYDLIGRVTPGAAITLCLLTLPLDGAKAKAVLTFVFVESRVPSAFIAVVGLFGCYLIGTLLGAIGFFVDGREWRVARLEPSDSVPPDMADESLRTAYMYDAIQFHDPRAGARLAKMRAEEHMCRVLLVGFVMMLVAHIILNFRAAGSVVFWSVLGAYAGTLLSAYLFYKHLDIRTTRLLCNQWHILGLGHKVQGICEDIV
jgi:hypothetical protein